MRMNTYLLSFNAEPSTNDFWCDSPKPCKVSAESVNEAIKKYIAEEGDLTFSKSAFKHKGAIYQDTKTGTIQCGYVISASTYLDINQGWKKRYLKLWVTIDQLINPFETV